jgi:DNA-binding CsgD family transcriptional regulator
MNWLAQYREHGASSFFTNKQPQRKRRIMTNEKEVECTSLLAKGHYPAEVARLANIGESTLRKAIARGQIILPVTTVVPGVSQSPGSTKACRSRDDAEAAKEIGTACTRADERTAAAFGLVQSATSRFEACSDVSFGGLLAGLPALCANPPYQGWEYRNSGAGHG